MSVVSSTLLAKFLNPRLKPLAVELCAEAVHREAHHIVIAAIDARDKAAARALYAVAAGFIHGLAAGAAGK